MRAYSQPFKQVFVWTAVTSIVVALVEIGLIYYMGWVVDALSGDPAQVWQNHGAFLIALAPFAAAWPARLAILPAPAVARASNTSMPMTETILTPMTRLSSYFMLW